MKAREGRYFSRTDLVSPIERCLHLAEKAMRRGNLPFGALIICNDRVVAEGENAVNTRLDVTAHAEVVAIQKASRTLGRLDLSDCTLYSNCEPCWICGVAIRMVGISRVVFGSDDVAIGAYSTNYPILRDAKISRFGPPPEVVAGILADRSQAMFAAFGWSPSEHRTG